MRDYELLLLIRPTLDAEGASGVSKQAIDLIEGSAGSIDSNNMWGRRKLAYQIDNHNDATYNLIKFKAEPGILRDLEFNLKLNESILRYLIIRDLHPQSTELQDEEASDEASTEASVEVPEADVDTTEDITTTVDEPAAEISVEASAEAPAADNGLEDDVEAAEADTGE